MTDWEDFRLFDILGHSSTLREAAKKAGISHSTLSRRMEALEASVGARLFVRGPRGFELTEEGGTLRESVGAAAEVFDTGLRAVAGADTQMRGVIRITLPDFMAYYGLLERMKGFQADHPDIDFEVDISYDQANLTKREADIAVRLVGLGQSPDDALVGRKVGQSHACGYAHLDYLAAHDLDNPSCGAVWLGWEPGEHQTWIASTPYPHFAAKGAYNHAELQHHAARAGLGLSYIPICIGDADPELVRLPNMHPKPARDIWVLTHADLRNTRRLRVFRQWIGEAIKAENF